MNRLLSTFLFATCCFGIWAGDTNAQGRHEIIAETGQIAIGSATYEGFQNVLLNDAGEVTYRAELARTANGTADDYALFFRTANGQVQVVLRESDAALDANGEMDEFLTQGLDDDGRMLIWARHRATRRGTQDDTALLTWNPDNATLSQFAREDNAAFDNNGTFSDFSSSSGFNAFATNGSPAFLNETRNSSMGSSDSRAVFDNFRIARESGTAPSGGTITLLDSFITANENRQFAFFAKVDNESTVMLDTSGLEQVYNENDAAPDGNGFFSGGVGRIALNSSEQLAFAAFFAGTDNGFLDDTGIVRLSRSGQQVQIVREGQTVPEGNGKFANFPLTPQINERGQVCFTAPLRETSGGTAGVYRADVFGSSSLITEIFREGQLTDTDDGTLFGVSNYRPGFNESGVAAVNTFLLGTSNSQSIVLGDGREILTTLQTGQPLANSSVMSAFAEFEFKSANSFNDYGQVATKVDLASGGEVISLWTPDLHYRETFDGDWDTPSRWTLGLTPAHVHDVFIDPPNSLEVEGPSTDTQVRSLTVGGGNGIATLELEDGATLTVASDVVDIESTGILTGDGNLNSNVENRGEVIADNVSMSGLLDNLNGGIITGTGRIVADSFRNRAAGDIRVEPGQDLVLDGGSLFNEGLVDVVGGTLEIEMFASNEPSTGLIFASDATLRFQGGLSNSGSLGIVGGTTYIYGDNVDNNSTGIINVSGGASAVFLDDLTQNGTLQVVSIGNTNSSAVFFGEFNGAGGFTGGGDVFALGDLRPGNSPASVLMDGNLFLGTSTTTEIEIGGINQGEFDQLIVTGDLGLAGNLEVSFIDGFELDPADEFVIAQIDGVVSGMFDGLTQGSQVGTSGLFVFYDGGDGNDIVLAATRPQTVLVPDSVVVTKGTPNTGDAASLAHSDNIDFSIRRRNGDIQSRTEFEVASTSPVASPSAISITLEGAVFARTNVVQTISLFNFANNTWEAVDVRSANRIFDRTDTVDATGDLSRFVEAGTKRILGRVLYRSDNPRQLFTSNTDLFNWTIQH